MIVHDDEFRGASLRDVVDAVRGGLPDLRRTFRTAALGELIAAGDPAAELPAVDPDGPAQLQYTSGTTGAPKGALLRHRSITNVARMTFERAGIGPGSTYLTPLPLFHTAACCIGVLGPLSAGGTLVLVSAFDPDVTLQLCAEEGVDAVGAVPDGVHRALAHPNVTARTTTVRTLIGGGAPVLSELIRRMEAGFGAQFINLFGQTELSPVATMVLPDDSPEDKGATVGTALPHVECRIIDPATGEVTPIGEQGEFCARGFSTMIEYFDDPEATAATLSPDGWLRTGDLCTMDERGYVTVTGRLKDMIIRGGENVYPVEIEGVLLGHRGVSDVAVVGLPDERWGEVVAAVIRPVGDDVPAVDELRSHAAAVLARHKIPTRWFVTDGFPLTGSGKVQKFVLRDQVERGRCGRSTRSHQAHRRIPRRDRYGFPYRIFVRTVWSGGFEEQADGGLLDPLEGVEHLEGLTLVVLGALQVDRHGRRALAVGRRHGELREPDRVARVAVHRPARRVVAEQGQAGRVQRRPRRPGLTARDEQVLLLGPDLRAVQLAADVAADEVVEVVRRRHDTARRPGPTRRQPAADVGEWFAGVSARSRG